MAIIGREIVRLESAGSTNDVALERGRQGAAEGLVVTAEEQTAGRGRLGRRWLAPRGTSLQLSVLLRPPLPPSQIFVLTRMTALAVASALEAELGLQPVLKWPNDVLLNSKKCAGILIETALQGDRLDYAVLGMGVNANFSMAAFPDLAPYATTLADELGRPVDRERLERALLTQLDDYNRRLRAGEDLFEEWKARLATLGREVRVATPGGEESGTAEGVDRDGALLLRKGEGLVRLYAGDVTILKDNPE